MRFINFSPGPSAIPVEVLSQLQASIMEYEDSGVGICELGHRSKHFSAIIEEAKSLIIELLDVPTDYDVIFMTGGATAQFSAVPLNFLTESTVGTYLVSGHWAKSAYEEAGRLGNVKSVGSTEELAYRKLPMLDQLPENSAYLHLTSNNTIFGTQIKEFPTVNLPLVCDASSDFLSRKMDVSKFTVIYSGAQKLVGTSGVTIVILNKNKLPEIGKEIPKVLDYKNYIANNSLFNTPPVFSIYSSLLTLRWLKAQGGLSVVEKRNNIKAKLLYDFLDSSKSFIPYVSVENKSDRSDMNVVFNMHDSKLEPKVIEKLKTVGLIGVEGYRSVGGFRVSLYNSILEEDVRKLIEVLGEF